MSSGEFPEAPPKPRLTIRVGVTGKRKLPKAEIERIGKELARVFEIIAQVLTDCWEKDKAVLDARPPVMRVICGLAEGTDQIAARIAVDRAERKVAPDSSVETRLAAILPFWQEEFI
jgi:hypothetical protein